MNKKIRNTKRALSRELHSNLMIGSTFAAMIGFVVLLLINTASKNPSLYDITVSASVWSGVASWVIAAVFAYKAVKEGKKYFLEYIIYSLLMGFGLFFMHNVPFFALSFVLKFGIQWAQWTFRVLLALTGVFFFGSIAWHGIMASHRVK